MHRLGFGIFLALVSIQALGSPSNCTSFADCNNEGFCDTSTGVCKCDDHYINSHDGTQCTYKQKQQLTAFLLHFFLGYFGAGEFYVGNNGLAAGQLVLSTGSGILLGIAKGTKGKCSVATGILGGIGGLASMIWWIADDVLFGKNSVQPD